MVIQSPALADYLTTGPSGLRNLARSSVGLRPDAEGTRGDNRPGAAARHRRRAVPRVTSVAATMAVCAIRATSAGTYTWARTAQDATSPNRPA